jgi:hypothetical protein
LHTNARYQSRLSSAPETPFQMLQQTNTISITLHIRFLYSHCFSFVDSEGFWWWCITLKELLCFWTLSFVRNSKN